MSRSGFIELDFGGEPNRAFRLGIGELERLDEELQAGPALLAARTAIGVKAQGAIATVFPALVGECGRFRANEVRTVIYQGLLGGGAAPKDAGALTRTYVDGRPLMEGVPVAYAILMAALLGVDSEAPAGESEGEGTSERLSPTDD